MESMLLKAREGLLGPAAGLLLAVAPLVGCAPGGEADVEEYVDSHVDGVSTMATLRVFAWEDGSASMFSWPAGTDQPYVVDHYRADGRRAWGAWGSQQESGAPSYIARGADAALHDGTIYTAFTTRARYQGTRPMIQLGAIRPSSSEPRWSEWYVVSQSSHGESLGPTRMAADAGGTLYLVYGSRDAVGATSDDASAPASSRRSLQLATCTSLDVCVTSQIIDSGHAHRDRYVIALGSEGPVVAVGRDQERDVVHVHERDGDGDGWEHTTIDLPGMGRVIPRIAAGGDRTVMAVSSVREIWEHEPAARYTLLFEKTDDGWVQTARHESLSVKNLDLRVGSDGVALFARRLVVDDDGSVQAATGQVLHESDAFAAREISVASSTWASDGGAALGPDGAVWHAGYVNSPGQLYLARSTPVPHRWAEDEGRGAGAIGGRDPCMVDSRAVVLQGSAAVTVRADRCVVVRDGFSGALTIDGSPEQPVHVIGGLITSRIVDAAWTFFDGTALSASGGRGGLAFERTSMSAPTDDVTVSGLRFVAPRSVASAAERTPIRLTSCLLGPYFEHALSAQGAIDVTIGDTTFRDTWGTAVRVSTEADGDPLTASLDDCDFVRARGALHAESVTSDLPVTVTRTAFVGGEPTTSVSWQPDVPVAAIVVRGGSGSIRDTSIERSASEGIRLDDVGLFTVAASEITGNGGHGIAVLGRVPFGLGPCEEVQEEDGPLAPPIAWDPDPLVEGCLIEGNGGAGIEVEYPSIPMQVQANRIVANALEGFAIRHGRGLSGRGPDEACESGFRRAMEVDVPLSPETHVTGNDLVGNGASADGHQLGSDHRLGTLAASRNYWGTSDAQVVEAAVACWAECEVTPFATQPIP